MKFVHIPTERTWLLPTGMIPLANLVKKYKDVEVIHYGIDPIDLSDEDIILFDLHWHDQALDVIDKCKELTCKKILGGFTATFYADEILNNYPVDYVVKGYAESELLKLMGINKSININELEYSNFGILRNYKKYLKDKTFVFTPGRGCPVNCTYCGGGKTVQKMCGLDKPIFLNPEKVVEELKNSLNYGINKWLVSFDPKPKGNYYIELFNMIDFHINCQFDCWGLPTFEFIDKFKETFENGTITISPRIGNEVLRFKNKGLPFTDSELYNTIDYIISKGINYKVYLASNFPEDNINIIIEKLGKENCTIGRIEWEPGSKLSKYSTFKALYLSQKIRRMSEN